MNNEEKRAGEWENKVVMISGGAGDIGLAVAQVFGRSGAKIALADIRDIREQPDRMQGLVREGIDYMYTRVDISDSAAVSGWVEAVHAKWNRIDVAVMNAATIEQQSVEAISNTHWQSAIDVNLNGAFYLAKQAAVYMKTHRIKGNLIFMGSWAAHAVHPGIPAYSVAKAAIRMLCQCMALEFAPFGIRVNELAPGYVNAGLSKKVWQDDPAAADDARQKVPVGYLTEPEEVAQNLLWICHENNRSLTGSTWLMDGGLSLLRP